MHLAFYAPMKPPDDPVPSGDRTIARNLITALETLGAEVSLASRLRSRDGRGDGALQRKLMAEAETEADRLIATGRVAGWQAWITYHSYYKAPDLIGPAVSRALRIPYLQIEATRARKRLSGPWALFAGVAEKATDAARVVFYFTLRDAESLRTHAPEGQDLLHLRPFLPQVTPGVRSDHSGPMLSVGMMREGDKLASYRLIADTLGLVQDDGWRLDIAGDGPARAQVEKLMAPFGAQVRFLGRLESAALQAAYARARLMFWPGVNEALGMIYLEAQAAGVPIVAQDRPGMNELLAGRVHPAPQDGPAGLARRLSGLLSDPSACRAEGQAARDHVAAHHLMPAAADTLRAGLRLAGVAA